MRVIAAFAFLILLATFAPRSRLRIERPPAKSVLSFERLPLESGAPGRNQVGRLTFVGGWRIASNDPRFGGISAMHVGPREVTAVSDSGSLIRFPLPGFSGPVRVEALPDGPGSPWVKGDRDAEAMTAHGGNAWIAFERSNQVWRYRRGDWRSDSSASPAGMRKWRSNRGSEAMLRLPGGRFLVFSEGVGGASTVLLFDGDPAEPETRSTALRYRPPEGYRITDAALLPGGGLLFLNRRIALLEGFSAKLGIAAHPRLAAGATLAGEEVAALVRPLNVDNMEALSVTREAGRTIVWIASDDNFNPLQRTLLLKFALRE